jgi:hypothetical protein
VVHNRELEAENGDDVRSRVGAYLLLADLLEWGPKPRLRKALETSSILAEGVVGASDQDDLDASHTKAFGFEAFPYEGVFLTRAAQAGAAGEGLQAIYRNLDFDPEAAGLGRDHLATLLRALAHAGVSEASQSEEGASLEGIHRNTRDLFDLHLSRWLPIWVASVRRLGDPWPTALVDQIWDLVAWHRSTLGGDVSSDTWQLEPLPDLEDSDTDLRTIADALARPVLAGTFLTRHDIGELARQVRAPTGFGSRSQLLENTLQSAASYSALPSLLARLQARFEEWGVQLANDFDRSVPGLEAATAPWRSRVPEVTKLLQRVADAAQAAA